MSDDPVRPTSKPCECGCGQLIQAADYDAYLYRKLRFFSSGCASVARARATAIKMTESKSCACGCGRLIHAADFAVQSKYARRKYFTVACGRALSPAEIAEIERLCRLGWSTYAISREVGRDDRTVNRYRPAGTSPMGRSRMDDEGKGDRRRPDTVAQEAAATRELYAALADTPRGRNITFREWKAEERMPRWDVTPASAPSTAWASPVADMG